MHAYSTTKTSHCFSYYTIIKQLYLVILPVCNTIVVSGIVNFYSTTVLVSTGADFVSLNNYLAKTFLKKYCNVERTWQ